MEDIDHYKLLYRLFCSLEQFNLARQILDSLKDTVDCIPEGHRDRADRLYELGMLYLDYATRSRGPPDLDQAIKHMKDAVELTASDHPDWGQRVKELKISCFVQTGMAVLVGDIRKASAYGQMAVDLTPGNNTGSIGWLKFIGAIYEECFEQFKEKEDLEKAIRYRQEVVNITPVNHPDRPDMLNSLGQVLLMSFEYFDKQQDLERAIICHQEAVDMVPDDHPTKALRVNALASSLVSRYTGFGSMADLDLAIQYYLNIVTITRDQSDKANYLHKLANALCVRFKNIGELRDLEEAIRCLQEALLFAVDNDQCRAEMLSSLGGAFQAR
ncbi:hypothetical protein GLOTRDRAFT_134472 [Gloeophyllum trabeum ATCC 11539]|uniref:TPR-like protein n=1 Tax=Gloeophyllum trabeum (strain ATCC 11539 / FP-39264 / Madison 617) TaxID=670483 RepID=S7R6A4_GLOTA|nr:uncharacterized protein GLOTRDRAFT_134472 [Gloeophyllum trabeum ATCC 11539]EPQ49910.1 hypothetical protein GLOTRDRAFT_134472 [Gloeophyllum trabeum ATCC 11539]